MFRLMIVRMRPESGNSTYVTGRRHWKFSSHSYIKSHSDRVCFNKLCINSTLKSITMLYHISEYYNGDE